MKSGHSRLPLHGGHCPSWLFEKMKTLGTAVVETILLEFGRKEVLRRMADPCWFQSMGCALGFDWHSSGLTTVLCGALKEGINPRAHEYGIFIAGGKGATSRKTPHELEVYAEENAPSLPVSSLQKHSKMAAKVDSSALQDGYQIYHHNFFVSKAGDWTVVQQGMNKESGWARRYHWLSDGVESWIDQPHAGISANDRLEPLNLTHPDSKDNREHSAELTKESPATVLKEYQAILQHWDETKQELQLARRHDFPRESHMDRILTKLYEQPAEKFEDLLGTDGVGPKTIRALSMMAEVIWGARPSYEDPARYTFAHGGKDGHPFPVHRQRYDKTTRFLGEALKDAKINRTDKIKSLKRLSNFRQQIKQTQKPTNKVSD